MALCGTFNLLYSVSEGRLCIPAPSLTRGAVTGMSLNLSETQWLHLYELTGILMIAVS